MFDWINDLIDAIATAISEAFEFLGTQISNTIWNTMLRWFYETIYEAVADFFTLIYDKRYEDIEVKDGRQKLILSTCYGSAKTGRLLVVAEEIE